MQPRSGRSQPRTRCSRNTRTGSGWSVGRRCPYGVEGTIDASSDWIVTGGRSRVRRHRPHPSEPGSRSLPLVVRHERIDRSEVGSGCHVDRVQVRSTGSARAPAASSRPRSSGARARLSITCPAWAIRTSSGSRSSRAAARRIARGTSDRTSSQETRPAPVRNVRSALLSGSSTTSLTTADASK